MYQSWAESVTRKRIKRLRTDCGTEFCSNEFEEYLQKQRILHEKSTPYCHSQNGVAERAIQTLTQMARCSLTQCNAPRRFWSEAIRNAAFTINVIPHRETKEQPFRLFFGKEFDPSRLKPFGCVTYLWVPRELRKKFDLPGQKMIFMSYPEQFDGYKLFDPSSSKVVVSRNLRFCENQFYWRQHEESDILESFSVAMETDDIYGQQSTNIAATVKLGRKIPNSYKEALTLPEQQKWLDAMYSEMTSLAEHESFEEVEYDGVSKVIDTRWVFDLKDPPNQPPIFKARFVAKGFRQVEGVDFTDVYAPVVNFSTVRMALTVAAKRKYYAKHLDIKTAFLNGILEEEVLVTPPEGFRLQGKVWRLRKSLYGLKQAPRCWYKRLSEILLGANLKMSKNDSCLFINTDASLIVLAYVDDLLVLAAREDDMTRVIKLLSKEVSVKDLGTVKRFCGIDIKMVNGCFHLSQEKMIDQLLEQYQLENCRETNLTPLAEFKAFPIDDLKLTNKLPIRNLIGSLQYLSCRTRPDITASVNFISRFMNSPSHELWNAAKNILRYLKFSKQRPLVLGHLTENTIDVYTDSNHGDTQDRKSTSGVLVQLFGSSVAWFSRKQGLVATSSAEAEFYSLSLGIDEGIWLSRILFELGEEVSPFRLLCDNQSAIAIFKHGPTQQSKKIDIRFYHVLDNLKSGTCTIEYVPTKLQLADCFTKPLKSRMVPVVLEKILGPERGML